MVSLAHPFGLKPVVRTKPAWTPWALGSALTAWWSARDLADGAVASWLSRKGVITPVQATGTSQPIKSATACNGYPGVTFDGVDDQLAIANTTGLPTAAVEGELWFVGSFASSALSATPIAYGGGGGANNRVLSKFTNDTGRVGNGTNAVVLGPVTGYTILGGFFGATALNGRMNGVAYGPTNVALSTGTTRTRLGANAAGTAAGFHNLVIGEILIITGLLSLANRERMEGYLAWEYSLNILPNNHPYKETRPRL